MQVASLKSVLVPLDLTAASDRVLGRLKRLPLDAEAVVTLLHVTPAGLQPAEQRHVERDARRALGEEAEQLRAELPRTIKVEWSVTAGAAASVISQAVRARGAELVVMGRGGARMLRDTFLGSTAERVIRTAHVPVLAVRLAARSAYARPCLAAALDMPLGAVTSWLCRLMPEPRRPVQVIHAVASPFEGRMYPSLPEADLAEYRAELRQQASAALGLQLQAALADLGLTSQEAPSKLVVRHGSPRVVVPTAVGELRGDLLAMGTRAASGLSHALLGSVAGDLLRAVACDVLIVPP